MGGRTRSASRAFPTGFLGMVALVVAFELALIRQDTYLTEHAECWRSKASASAREAAGCDILCFGDSQVEFGVLPRGIEARLGGRAYNLALHSGPPAAAYFLLKRALDAGAKPRAIVVDFTPRQLARAPDHDETRVLWPDLAGVGETIHLAHTTSDAGFAAQLWASQVLSSFKVRHEVRASIRNALKGRAYSCREGMRLARRNWQVNRGAYVLPPSLRVGLVANPESPDLFDPWRCDPMTARYVDRFLRLAASEGIAVVWLIPPISPEFQARRDQLGLEAPYTAFLHARLAESPNLRIIDGRHAGYGAMLFADEIHLDRRGATALSEDLAARLDPSRPAPRWSELSPYREPAPAPLVEDLEQSKVALGYKRPTASR